MLALRMITRSASGISADTVLAGAADSGDETFTSASGNLAFAFAPTCGPGLLCVHVPSSLCEVMLHHVGSESYFPRANSFLPRNSPPECPETRPVERAGRRIRGVIPQPVNSAVQRAPDVSLADRRATLLFPAKASKSGSCGVTPNAAPALISGRWGRSGPPPRQWHRQRPRPAGPTAPSRRAPRARAALVAARRSAVRHQTRGLASEVGPTASPHALR